MQLFLRLNPPHYPTIKPLQKRIQEPSDSNYAGKKLHHTHPLEQGAVFHSDRGSQYGSGKFRTLLERLKIRQSMSARANPYDNAWSESVIGTIKAEVLQGGRFADADDARTELFDYIESYYNHHRKHSSIGNLTPSQFEKSFYQN